MRKSYSPLLELWYDHSYNRKSKKLDHFIGKNAQDILGHLDYDHTYHHVFIIIQVSCDAVSFIFYDSPAVLWINQISTKLT